METYKTYTAPENGKVGAFENQFGNITVEVTLSKNYSLEYFDDETEDERTNDFHFEHGKSQEAIQAISLINEYIKTNL